MGDRQGVETVESLDRMLTLENVAHALCFQIFITFVFFQVVCNYLLVKRHPSLYSTTAHTDPGLVLEQHSRLLVESFGQSDNASPLRPVGDDSADALRRETVVLSWRLCVYCNHYAPPRSHHCKVIQPLFYHAMFRVRCMVLVSFELGHHVAGCAYTRLCVGVRVCVKRFSHW